MKIQAILHKFDYKGGRSTKVKVAVKPLPNETVEDFCRRLLTERDNTGGTVTMEIHSDWKIELSVVIR